MSHGDSIKKLPKKAKLLSQDEQGLITSFSMDKILCFQFHPEVFHTEKGKELLKHYALKICQASKIKKKREFREKTYRRDTKKGGDKTCFLCFKWRGGFHCDGHAYLKSFKKESNSLSFCGHRSFKRKRV